MVHSVPRVSGGDLVVTVDNGQLRAIVERVFVEAQSVEDTAGGPYVQGVGHGEIAPRDLRENKDRKTILRLK